MYAITSNSYRAITSVSDVLPGETAVDQLPASLLTTLEGAEIRAQHDRLLTACDWTQGSDSPFDATAKAQWAIYRQALRNVPQQSGFPQTIMWPTPP